MSVFCLVYMNTYEAKILGQLTGQGNLQIGMSHINQTNHVYIVSA